MECNTIYKAAIIGCGWIGVGISDFAPQRGAEADFHANAYKKCERTKLAAVCDRNFDRALRAADQWDAEPYCDITAMINKERPDIVSICTQPDNHAFIVNKLAGYVKAIYCEKPIANTVEDAQTMIDACRDKTILQINHQRRFLIPTFYYSRGIMDTGTHLFDLLRELFGEIEIISAFSTDKRDDPNPGGLIKTERGLIIKIEPNLTNEHIFHFCPSEVHDFPILEGVKHLVDCLDNGTPSKSNGEDGLEALKLVLKFKEIASNGKCG